MAAKQTSILGSVSSLLLGEQMDFGSSNQTSSLKSKKAPRTLEAPQALFVSAGNLP